MKTVTQLIKELQKIEKQAPRAKVLVDWKSFESDEHTHEHIAEVELDYMAYDDGESKYRKDGSEKMSRVVSLKGHFE